jgi:outer membrane protein
MNKISIMIVTIFLLIDNIQAQTKKWTLEQCIEYALNHNIDVKKSANQINALEIKKSTLKNCFLPDLNAGGSQKFAFGRSLNRNNMYENNNIQNCSFSISTELTLFSGFKRTASIKQNKYDLLASIAEKKSIEDNITLNVTSAFFQILLNKEIQQIAEEQVKLTKEQINKTTQLIEAGKIPLSQLYEVKAQLANDELELTEAKNSVRLAKLDLAQLMELDKHETLDLVFEEKDMTPIIDMNPINIYHAAESCMPQIKQAYYNLQSKEEEIQIAKSAYYPSIHLGAGITTGYYHYNNGISDTFKKQLNNNMQKSIYITINIPIFDRFSTRNQIKTARIEKNNAELSLTSELKTLYKNIEKTYIDAITSFEKYQATIKSVISTREALRYAIEKYDAGKSSVFEYNEQKMKLADALSQQTQAKYTFFLKEYILNYYSCHALD